MLADEPTGAVDTKTADQIYELFHELNRKLGITIIIVTHDMALADRVDRTVLISDGKVSTEKLKKHPAMEYTVLDKAHRIKLTDEMLEAAGIESNKVKVDVQDGRLVVCPAYLPVPQLWLHAAALLPIAEPEAYPYAPVIPLHLTV